MNEKSEPFTKGRSVVNEATSSRGKGVILEERADDRSIVKEEPVSRLLSGASDSERLVVPETSGVPSSLLQRDSLLHTQDTATMRTSAPEWKYSPLKSQQPITTQAQKDDVIHGNPTGKVFKKGSDLHMLNLASPLKQQPLKRVSLGEGEHKVC